VSKEIKQTKRDADVAWQNYITAFEKAAENRERVRGARTAIFRTLQSSETSQQSQNRTMRDRYRRIRDAEHLQAELDAEEIRLGNRFDQISDQLAELQQKFLK